MLTAVLYDVTYVCHIILWCVTGVLSLHGMLSLSGVTLTGCSVTDYSLFSRLPSRLQEGQLRELARLSGDSSEQMSYLNEQLREKDREIEELHTTVATLTEEVSRSKDDLDRSQGSSSQELARVREGQERDRREYLIQMEALVSKMELCLLWQCWSRCLICCERLPSPIVCM